MAFNRKEVKKYLIVNEDYRPEAYKDTKGIPTAGVGFNLRREDARAKLAGMGVDIDEVIKNKVNLSANQIDTLLNEDINDIEKYASIIIPDFSSLDSVRSTIVLDMIFNLGPKKFSGFKKLIAAINAKDWNKAAAEMIDSKWYVEVKDRGVRNVEAMKTGIMPPVENDIRIIENRTIKKYGGDYKIENPPKMPTIKIPQPH